MNGNSRHTHHNHHKHQPRPSQRRRLRRRQQVTVIFAVVGITLLVLLTAFLIIGARMHKKSAELRETDTETEAPIPTPETPSTPSIIAYPLPQSSPSASLATFRAQGKTGASLALNSESGAPLYNASTIGAIAAEAKQQGVYLSGVFTLTSLSESDDLLRFRALSEDCATVAEALRAGLDEVILIPPSLTENDQKELLAFLTDLRRLVPNATVGLALPHEFLSAATDATDEASPVIDALAEQFSLLAVQLSDKQSIDDAVEADLYHLLRYSMRVLLPNEASERTQAEMIEAVASHGINNIQILP